LVKPNSSKSAFKDLFSKQASAYAQFRPKYPPELFEFVASLPQDHKRAWDCGTGNGQAAVGLAQFFDEVIATDPSFKQLEHATKHPKITYLHGTAEKAPIEDQSVNLITAAAAAHWFQFDQFYQEVNRVLKPGGCIALWTYGHNRKLDPKIDVLLDQFENEKIGRFWAPEIQIVRDQYRTIPFPFQERKAPSFQIEREMDLTELIGYFSSWSATQKYIESNQINPLIELEKDLEKIWGPPELKYKMTWPIYFRVGFKN
jgi:SAM-dependent methyltransferase